MSNYAAVVHLPSQYSTKPQNNFRVLEWRPIDFAPGYYIRSDGAIDSFKRGRPYRMKPMRHSQGYRQVKLNGKRWFIHRLVALVFIGPAPQGDIVVHHVNHARHDNLVDNLAYLPALRTRGAANLLPRLQLPMSSTEQFRATVANLESAVHTAGARLVEAERLHNLATRSAIASNDYTSDKLQNAERELTSSRAAFDRQNHALSIAREMLAQAVAEDRAAAQAAARQDIEARISELAELAAKADATFADLCAQLLHLQRTEIEARARVRTAFGAQPTGAPLTLSVAPALASHLRNMGNGLTPETQPWTSEALQNSFHRIRLACAE